MEAKTVTCGRVGGLILPAWRAWLLRPLPIILLLALGLRLWGLDFGLPYLRHPDEPRYLRSALILFKTGSLDPRTLPDLSISAFVYVVNALADWGYFGAGKLLGLFASRADVPEPQMLGLGIGRIAMPSLVVWGRCVTLSFGLATVWGVAQLGRRLDPAMPTTGWLAALMVAISPTLVLHSRTITPDMFVVCFVLLAVWAAVEIVQQGRMRAYWIGGAALGLAVGAKLNGAFVGLPLLVAHFVQTGVRGLLDRRIYWLGAAAAAALLVSTPYLLGDPAKVWADIQFERQHYATGHAGMEGESLRWYLTHLWRAAGPFYFLALLGIIRAAARRERALLLVALYVVGYFSLISLMVVRNDRTLLPILPLACLLAAHGLAPWIDRLGREKWGRLGVALLVLGLGATPLYRTIYNTQQLVREDGFAQASRWIATELPPGTKIAVESYGAFVDPADQEVHGFGRMIDLSPQWYRDEGFAYLVFGRAMYGRYVDAPAQYPDEAARYEELFTTFPLVREFDVGGTEVRIYAVTP